MLKNAMFTSRKTDHICTTINNVQGKINIYCEDNI